MVHPGFDLIVETSAPTIFLGAKEKMFEPITEAQVPNLKYGFRKNSTLMPPYAAVHTYQYLGADLGQE